MRYGPEHREQTHDSLIQAASALVRRDGPDGVSVVELMKSVGLTHGGFYYHFSSREEMVERAIERAFSSHQKRLESMSEGKPPLEALREYIEKYLSPAHRDNLGVSCPIATLSGHLSKVNADGRKIFERGAAGLTTQVAALLAEIGHADAGALAVSIVSELSGALNLSRVVSARTRSDEVLRISARYILARVSSPQKSP